MSADLVPVPTPTMTSPADIETAPAELRGQMVTQALVESRSWLAVAQRGTDPKPLAEFKAWAATVAEMTRQMNLAKEIQLDATEMVRRAERGIGLTIRAGQEAGTIAKPGDIGSRGAAPGSKGGSVQGGPVRGQDLLRPKDIADTDFLSAAAYPLTDGVTDEQFDEAIAEAKAEENVSRANVRAKVRGDQPRQTGRPDILRKTRRIDPDRLISESIAGAGLPPESVFNEVDFADLDHARIEEWVSSLTDHIAALRSLRNRLMKELTRRG